MSVLQARHKPGAQGATADAIAWKPEEQAGPRGAWSEGEAGLVGQDPGGGVEQGTWSNNHVFFFK